MSTETDLRERLHRIAERTAPPEDPFLATRIAATSRSRRRQRIGLTALVAGVAAVVVAVPAVLSGPRDAPAGPAAPATSAGGVDVFAGPTRGSLAGDADFIEGLRQLPWDAGMLRESELDPPVEARHVVWAGDVPGGRWALVAAENTTRPSGTAADPDPQEDRGALNEVAIAWVAGPLGASADQMQVVDVPHGVDPSRPVARFDPATGALVVVASREDDVIELSRRPEVAADATVSRTWEPAEATDGVAVLALPVDGTTTPAVQFRVQRDGAVAGVGRPGTAISFDPPPTIPVEWLRPLPTDSLATGFVPGFAQDLLWTVGLPADAVEFAVPWVGPGPVAGQVTTEITLITATLPSGAVFAQADVLVRLAGGFDTYGGGCGTDLGSAGPPPAERTYVLRCDVAELASEPGTLAALVVVGPRSAAVARLLDADGRLLGSLVLRDGVVVGEPVEGLATVQTLAADGTVLAETAPMGFVEWE